MRGGRETIGPAGLRSFNIATNAATLGRLSSDCHSLFARHHLSLPTVNRGHACGLRDERHLRLDKGARLAAQLM